MAISITLLLLNILVFMMAMVVLIYAIPSRQLPPIRWLLVLVGSFCVVSFCTLGVYMSKNLEVQILFSRMRFLTLGLLPSSWLLFIGTVYGRWNWLQKKWVTAIIFLPGIMTSVFTLIPRTRNYVTTNYVPVIVEQFSVLEFHPGPWFSVHYISAMILVFLSVGVGAYTFFCEKGIRRYQVLILILASTLAAGVDIYCVLTNSPLRWLMLSSGTFLFSLLGIVFAAMKLRLLNIVPLAMAKVFQEFPDPVIVLDGENIIRDMNKSAIQFFGLSKKMIGQTFFEILPEVRLLNGEVAINDQKGDKRFFNLTIEKLITDSEGFSGKVVYFREITIQKGIENRLNQNLEFKARLLALVAHDLTGHMEGQAVLSLSMQEDVEGTLLQEKFNLLIHSVLASQGVVTNLMSWIKGQGTQFEPVYKEFEWNMLIKECIEDLSAPLRIKNISIEFESFFSPVIGMGDSDMLGSVFRNILLNSIRATPNGKNISILFYASEKNAEITVIDQGIGMSSKQLESVRANSEDFTFQNSSSDEFKGNGIGLMIVKNFIKLHKGQFSIESDLGLGTRVSFYIPLR